MWRLSKDLCSHVRQIILYGSYARGDFRPDSDVDIMILVEIKEAGKRKCGSVMQIQERKKHTCM